MKEYLGPARCDAQKDLRLIEEGLSQSGRFTALRFCVATGASTLCLFGMPGTRSGCLFYPELRLQLLHCRGCLPRAKCRRAQMQPARLPLTRSRYARLREQRCSARAATLSLKEGGKFCEHCGETARSASRLAATMTGTGRWMGPQVTASPPRYCRVKS
jgi:hypothetical protein